MSINPTIACSGRLLIITHFPFTVIDGTRPPHFGSKYQPKTSASQGKNLLHIRLEADLKSDPPGVGLCWLG